MARYKAIDTSPRFLAVDLEKQLLPGSFEHAVHHLLDHEFDLSRFDTRYRNGQSGACAYPPGMLLKVILCAYTQGVSSRGIERLCREHVIFIALSGDAAPHCRADRWAGSKLALVAQGVDETSKLIARRLGISPRTVGAHRARMIRKLGVSSAGELIFDWLAFFEFHTIHQPSGVEMHRIIRWGFRNI